MTPLAFEPDPGYADAMDASDPLAPFRNRFHIPRTPAGEDAVYLTGHSLGLQPVTVREAIEEELQSWQSLAVDGHFHGVRPWTRFHKLLTATSAKLVGAEPAEVVIMNTLTVNLHLMMVSFYRPTPDRFKILIEVGAFPSDRYAVCSQIRFHGFDPGSALIELRPRAGDALLRQHDIEAAIHLHGASLALVLFPGVNYSTGQAFDIGAITSAAQEHDCPVGFDLAHAVGNVPLQLHDAGPDFAVWCTYKYLNGGPGSIAGCFVHERHAHAFRLPRFAGWWGHDEESRFRMGPDFHPIPGAEGWQLSNPPILALAALRASLALFEEAGLERLRAKSVMLTEYLLALLDHHRGPAFTVITPSQAEARGAQLSIRLHTRDRSICSDLAAKGVVCDWREPDILRAAPVPLYNSFRDVHRFVECFLALLP